MSFPATTLCLARLAHDSTIGGRGVGWRGDASEPTFLLCARPVTVERCGGAQASWTRATSLAALHGRAANAAELGVRPTTELWRISVGDDLHADRASAIREQHRRLDAHDLVRAFLGAQHGFARRLAAHLVEHLEQDQREALVGLR